MFHSAAHFDAVRAADHFVDRAKAQLGHMLAHFLGDEAHEVDDMGWIAGKFLAQLGILRRHTHRTSIEMADPHHDAAQGHQRRGGKAKFLGAEQRGDHDIAAGLQLAVGFHGDTAAQIIEHQGLVRLRETQLPGQAGMFDAGLRRSAGAAVMAADQHDIGMAFGHARGNGADTDFRNQLHADARMMIGVLEIVNQLRQIFDGIDIMVRRRRDQTDARRRVAHFGDPRIDFSPRQFAAFSRLGALGHLDLQLSAPGSDNNSSRRSGPRQLA